jgi:hypothetical protein
MRWIIRGLVTLKPNDNIQLQVAEKRWPTAEELEERRKSFFERASRVLRGGNPQVWRSAAIVDLHKTRKANCCTTRPVPRRRHPWHTGS